MGVKYFDEWVEKEGLAKHGPLEFLKGSVLGVDAAYFSKQFLVEPLLTALGGAPIALEGFTNAVKNLTNAGVGLHFVFNGLQYSKQAHPFASSECISSENALAFSQYESQKAETARRAFQMLATPQLDEHMDVLKAALYKLGVPFTVAPYSALAQLAYYEKHSKQFIDAVYGPNELFCFGVDKVLTDFVDFSTKDHAEKVSITDTLAIPEKLQFRWIDSNACLRALGGINAQLFMEALILAGSDQLTSTYPPLIEKASTTYNQQPAGTLREAVNYLVTTRGNLSQPLEPYHSNWLDEYKQIMTITRHHVVITIDGDVEALDKEQAPIDTHVCIGLRLPEELYMYLSRGLVGVRVLNWLTRNEIIISIPLAGAEAPSYRKFVAGEMDSLRKQAICLLTEGIHRYYQRADFRTLYWFDRNPENKFKPVDVSPSPRTVVGKWNVREELLEKARGVSDVFGSLAFAIQSLDDDDFAKRTITPKPKNGSPLSSRREILTNSVWRFLQLRNFVDDSHQLTSWGNILQVALTSVGGVKELEEAVFIAVELLRLGLLNQSSVSAESSGSPANGTARDRASCMLVSRVASLGHLRHKPKGYSGPLSRSLLAYHSIVSTLQLGLRDLLEMNMVAMFLEGGVNRDRRDWMELSLALPFRGLPSCSLGIATLSYLDHLENHGDPTAQATHDETRLQGQKWIKYSEFGASLDDAFRLWDAVYQSVKSAGDLVQEQQMWDETNAWLSQRR